MDTKVWNLPQLQLMFHVKQAAATDLLVVAGGRRPATAWLQQAAAGRMVYCADKGGAYCHAARIAIEALYGDMDSGSTELYDFYSSRGVPVHVYPRAKDDTDLQLLLNYLPEGDILASGIWGGRFDHLYSNLYSLLHCKQQRQCLLALADHKEIMVLLEAGEAVKVKLQQPVEAISLLPLSAKVKVDFSGVQWPLQQAELEQLHPYAISNLPQAETKIIECTCRAGSLGLYLKFSEEDSLDHIIKK